MVGVPGIEPGFRPSQGHVLSVKPYPHRIDRNTHQGIETINKFKTSCVTSQ